MSPSATPSADTEMHDAPPDSPIPEKPIGLTPGPRAQAFTTLYATALQKTLSSISYESFAACFPEISKSAPEALRSMHGNFVNKLELFGKAEFETIIEERKVVEGLNRLEDLILDARRRKASAVDTSAPPVAPHTLPASEILRANIAPVVRSQQSHLNAKIQNVQGENARLAQTMVEQRKELRELVERLEAVVGDLEEGGKLLGAEEEITGDRARSAEGVIATSGF